MSPARVLRRRYWPLLLAAMLMVAAFAFSAWAIRSRTSEIDRFLFQQCVANEIQDTVIVAQLQAAKRRARASLPAGSAELLYQLNVLNDGIAALEPPDERDCQPPKGTQP